MNFFVSAGYVTSEPGQFYWEYIINLCQPMSVSCNTKGSGYYAIQRKAAEPHDDCFALSGKSASNVQLAWTDTTNQKTGGVTVTFSGGDKTDQGLPRSAIIAIECNPQQTQPALTFDREDPGNAAYYFKMSAREGCGKEGSPPASGGFDWAWFLFFPGLLGFTFIFVLIGFALYFIIGILVNKFKFQRSGAELIPQVNFWKDLPFLIKDGVMLIVDGCKKCTKRGKYTELEAK